MRIAIVSDSHNNLANAQLSTRTIAEAGVKTVIHCGDVIEAAMLEYWGEFQLFCVYGNGDYPPEIRERLSWMGDANQSGERLELELDGKNIFVTHGHRSGELTKAIESLCYDYVLHGHSHRFRDETVGTTRVINPGALGGNKVEPRSFVLLDLELDEIERVQLD